MSLTSRQLSAARDSSWDRPTAVTGFAGLLALAATYGIGRQVFGLFVPAFRAEFGLSLDVLGLYASAAQIGYLVMVVVTGAVTARFGVRLPVVGGCVILAAGSGLVALAPSPAWLAVGLVAAGASAGGTWAPFSDAVSDRVPLRGRGRALAMVNAGSPAGLFVAGLLVLLVGDRWRVAWALFAAAGLVAALVNFRVLRAHGRDSALGRNVRVRLGWFLSARSYRLFAATVGIALTSGAYFSFAPDIVHSAGLPLWSGPAMWVVLGLIGGAVGVFASDVAERIGMRLSLALAVACITGSMLLLFAVPGYIAGALASAAVFGIGFTGGFALIVLWSQRVFAERPATGFTATILFSAFGFSLGPALFGTLVTHGDQALALLVTTLPALLAALVRPAERDGDTSSPAST